MCSENEEKRISPEKPYAVLQQFMWEGGGGSGWNRWSTGPKLCSKLRTFATHKEALAYATLQSGRYPRATFYVVGATERVTTEPPPKPPVPPSRLTVQKLRPARRRRA